MMQTDNRDLKSSILSMILIAGTIFILDQLTKSLIVREFYLGQRSEIMSFFNLVHVRNYGAAFSFLSDAGGWQRWFLTGVSGVASIVMIYWINFAKDEKVMEKLSLMIILGGALGNFYDRLVLGYVIDFLDFHWSGIHFPAFNIADMAITIVAVLFIMDNLFLCSKKGS